MNAIQQANQWVASGLLDTLPLFISYETNHRKLKDGSIVCAITELHPKQGVLGNLEQLGLATLDQKRRTRTLENLAEIVESIQFYLKQTNEKEG